MNRIDEIEARLNSAVRTPWRTDDREPGRVYDCEGSLFGRNSVPHYDHSKPIGESVSLSDVAFIAAAPDDVRFLLSEVKRLEHLAMDDDNGPCEVCERVFPVDDMVNDGLMIHVLYCRPCFQNRLAKPERSEAPNVEQVGLGPVDANGELPESTWWNGQ